VPNVASRIWSRRAALVLGLLVACGDDDGAEHPEHDAAAAEGGTHGDAGSDAAGDAQLPSDGSLPDGRTDAALDATLGANADASINDVDLTLGGFHQELAPPSVNCVERKNLLLGCMSVSGKYNDEAFSIACEENSLTLGRSGSHVLKCRGPAAGGELVVELDLDPALLDPSPRTFAVSAPSALTFVGVWHLQRGFASYPDAVFDLAATHEQEIRVAGLAELMRQGVTNPPRYDTQIRGAFALDLAAKTSCVPDGMGRGCDDVALRGTFLAHPSD
jgi:hypothetical protein